MSKAEQEKALQIYIRRLEKLHKALLAFPHQGPRLEDARIATYDAGLAVRRLLGDFYHAAPEKVRSTVEEMGVG